MEPWTGLPRGFERGREEGLFDRLISRLQVRSLKKKKRDLAWPGGLVIAAAAAAPPLPDPQPCRQP